MTRESEKTKIRMNVVVDRKHINSLKKADEVIDKIFDKHETQLKAKENNLERQDMIIKCLNIDLDNKEKLLKAKDKEIKELGEIVQQYLIPSKNYDATIRDKDEEIERLKADLNHLLKELGGKYNEDEMPKDNL